MKALFTLSIFIVLCTLSIGHVLNYDANQPTLDICDVYATTQFTSAQRGYFNCTNGNYGTISTGKEFCADFPCLPTNDCSWQVTPGTQIVFNPGNKYYLYPCQTCPTYNCNGKEAI